MIAWVTLLLALVPLNVLDARITAYHTQLSHVNLSMPDRLALTGQMHRDMRARYRVLEQIVD